MKNLIVLLGVVTLCSACGLVPRPAQVLTQHDLGNDFEAPTGRKALPLRAISVSATQVVAGLSMYYRYNAQPTERGVYAYNRWAAPPATLVEQALTRVLPIESTGRCRLGLQISDVILEINRKGFGKLLLAGQLSVSLDGKNPVFKRVADVRVPLQRVEPAAEAEGLRDAVVLLANSTVNWMGGDIDKFCRESELPPE
jgi:cholesterol transport system auxiliary component